MRFSLHLNVKKVVLIFLDTICLSDFLLKHRIAGLEVNSQERAITGKLSNTQIKIPCEQFDARMDIVLPNK